MIQCDECNNYAKLILARGEINADEVDKLALDRHILKGCDKPICDESHVIRMTETSPEFRRGFISAMTCVIDMAKGAHTYGSLLSVVESILDIHKNNKFFSNYPVRLGSDNDLSN